MKIIYLHNKIYFFLFCFFPIFSSTRVCTFPQPLAPRLHCLVTTTMPPPCPPCHHCPLPTKIPLEKKPILKKKKKNLKPKTQKTQSTDPKIQIPILHSSKDLEFLYFSQFHIQIIKIPLLLFFNLKS